MNVLNLAGAQMDSSVEPGQYDAVVFEAEWGEVSGNGKLPAGTPRLDIQFQLKGEGVENRRVFTSFCIAPDKYEYKAMMDGMLANFLVALGYDKTKVLGGKFDIDLADLAGRECVCTVTRVPKKRDGVIVEGEFNNDVKVKKAGTAAKASSDLL